MVEHIPPFFLFLLFFSLGDGGSKAESGATHKKKRMTMITHSRIFAKDKKEGGKGGRDEGMGFGFWFADMIEKNHSILVCVWSLNGWDFGGCFTVTWKRKII